MYTIQDRFPLPANRAQKPWGNLHKQYGEFQDDKRGAPARFSTEAAALAKMAELSARCPGMEYQVVAL